MEYKKDQNWVKKIGNYFVFPGGGTQFRDGVNRYIEFIEQVLCLFVAFFSFVYKISVAVAPLISRLLGIYSLLTNIFFLYKLLTV